jgi:hypothetical protein|tara:strand:- start:498 stop:995 length:498 start_codon:yes stop_codon:yes gene_type:complete
MNETLFLVCPTDCLEARINKQYTTVNYFYTSLGNSFNIDHVSLKNIQELINNHSIRNIYFVLSSDNRFILDALEGHFFLKNSNLKTFYEEIQKQKIHSEKTWVTDHSEHLIISHFLNKKINQLQEEFANFITHPIHIKGLVYNKCKNSFLDVYSNLTIIKNHQLN